MTGYPFPPPPYLGTDTILPITSVQGLKEEGQVLGHCVGTYDISVLAGMAYIYKVLHLQRATLSLVRSGMGWVLEQIRRHKNASVSTATMDSVREWLSSVQGKRTDPRQ